MILSKEEKQQYQRQTQMQEVGEDGQLKFKQAAVLIVGLGGLGSPAALYLCAAGIGHLGLIDDDQVSLSNLHRQVMYSADQVGISKVQMAEQRLKSLNPKVKVTVYEERLTAQNALRIFSEYDLILDGADNFATRYLTNDAAYFAKKTLISASVLGFEGQLSVFDAVTGPCYRCLYPEPPPAGTVPSCAEAGVLGAMTGVMGSLQAMEACKVILNLDGQLKSHLLLCETLSMTFTKLQITKNADCPLCGSQKKITELNEQHFVCSTDLVIPQLSHEELLKWKKTKSFHLLDVREAAELSEGTLQFTHHIPLGELQSRYQSLPQETPLVVYCRSGGRSQNACVYLKQKGYEVYNLKNGLQGSKQG